MGWYVTVGTSEVRSIALRRLEPGAAGEVVAFVFVRLFLKGVWPATASAVRLLDERAPSGWRFEPVPAVNEGRCVPCGWVRSFILRKISSDGVTKAGTDVGLSASL